MRITGGIYKGRKLQAPTGITTRPTSDRVREALFNILAHRDWGEEIENPIRNKHILDVFAGTGALGLEALSYGAAQTVFIEQDRAALACLRQNIKTLKCEETSAIVTGDATQALPELQTYDLIFMDPPYRKNLVPAALKFLEKNDRIALHALFVIETAKKELLELPAQYELILTRSYGDTALHFYKK